MLLRCMTVYIRVVMSQQLHTCTGCKIFSSIFTIQEIYPLLLLLALIMQKFLTGLKDSRLQNKLAKSKAKKWTTMAQVLQDVADMTIDFERSHGYSLPMFDIQYVSSTNSSSS